MLPALALAAAARVVTLDAAIDTALARHPQLRASSAQVDLARARADVARAPLLPTFDLSMRYAVSMGDAIDDDFFSADGRQVYDVGVGGSWLVWDFGRARDRWDAARALVDAQAHDRDAAARDLVLDVELAYFGALAARRLAAIAAEDLVAEERHLREIQAFVEAEVRPEIELARARTSVAVARTARIRADNDYAVARARLAQAMGVAGADFEVADETLPAVPGEDGSTGSLVDAAAARRPEFAALAADLAAQRASLRGAEKGLYPSLRVSADLGYGGAAWDEPGWNASIGLTLTWTLFDGGSTRASARAERLALVVLDAEQEAMRQRLWVEIDEARLAVGSSKAGRVSAAEAATSARELLRLAERRYQEGVGNVIELADAQLAATAASAAEVQATIQLASARARLKWALGL